MGKYKYKLRNVKKRSSHVYNCIPAPHVTDWSGNVLNTQARKELIVGDIVRVSIDLRPMYIKICQIQGNHLTGVVDDPYRGCFYNYYTCDICHNKLNIKDTIYSDSKNAFDSDYHECSGCHKTSTRCLKLSKPMWCNGTIVSFKHCHISEIPNWTKNTCKIIDRHIIPNKSFLFTGLNY